MRLASIMSTTIVALITGPYILVNGLRAGVPLLIALVLGIIWSCFDEE